MPSAEERVNPIPEPARRDSGLFLLCMAATVVLYLLSIPLAYGMFVTGPLAGWFAARALYRSRKVSAITGFRVSLSAGVVVAVFAVVMAASLALFHDVVTELQDCMSRALTHQAEQQCQADYESTLNERLEDMLARLGA